MPKVLAEILENEGKISIITSEEKNITKKDISELESKINEDINKIKEKIFLMEKKEDNKSDIEKEILKYKEEIKKSKFIFSNSSSLVKDKKDHYPINTIGRARNALARSAQTDGKAPSWFKGTYKEFRSKVVSAVKSAYPSINISTKFENPHFKTICKLELPKVKKLSEGKPTVVNIEMIRSGLFEHPWYGEMNWTKEKLQHLVKNFDKKVIGRECSIDFNHNNRNEAAGWIKKLSVLPNGKGGHSLYGKVELTDVGELTLRNNRYKYFSIEWDENYKDKETNAKTFKRKEHGPVLQGGGLTNRPYIDKLSPILIQNAEIKTNDKLKFKKAA